MRIHRNVMLSAVVALAVAAPAAAGQTNDPQAAKADNQETRYWVCEDGDTAGDPSEESSSTEPGEDSETYLYFTGDLLLWPPNHKDIDYVAGAIAEEGDGTEGNEGDTITSFSVVATHDEVGLNGAGSPDQEADTGVSDADIATGGKSASADVTLQAERSGRGDGRVYSVEVDITYMDDDGGERMCDHTFDVFVPHDMRSDQGAANGKNGGASLDDEGNPKGGGNS